MNIASFLDSTNLKPEASASDIEDLCSQAAKYRMAAVCVQPYRLPLAARFLSGSQVKLCTVVGFPLGAAGMGIKLDEARQALRDGADEIDMVINLGAVKDRDYKTVVREINELSVLKQEQNFLLKVIVETALLSDEELISLTRLVSESGADYIKTSTGYASRGVTMKDIEIITAHKFEDLRIKASGGIRNIEFALELLQAGVSRLGTSNAVQVLEEYRMMKEVIWGNKE